MTNKYLEKVALNISKARSMAKAVGVIPDHTSSWKYALRHLRDSRGNPLQGKALHQARANLGDLDNNAFRKIQATSNKLSGTKGIEYDAEIHKGKLISNIREGSQGEINRAFEDTHNLHTHPDTDRTFLKSYLKLEKFPHRVAQPSGLHRLNRYMEDPIGQKIGKHLSSIKEYERAAIHHGNIVDTAKDPQTRANAKKIAEDSLKEYTQRVDYFFKNKKSPLEHDTKALASKFTLGNNLHTERIVAPQQNVVSANKFRPHGVRTIYFDHTPRKYK